MAMNRMAAAVCIGCFLVLGCREPVKPVDPPQPERTAASPASTEFRITSPKTGSTVDVNAISVRGTGAQPGDIIRVEVFTNQWFLQDGRYDINADGTWSYAPCHLSGRGNFRLHHNIKASLIRGGRTVAFDTVEEIKAPEPGA